MKRHDADYEIESLSKGLMVLEALEGIGFEPVSVSTIIGRTGFKRDLVFRSLKTLSLRGYAVCENGKWTLGKRLVKFSERVARHKAKVD
jgi:DNA-binding IclR family transcriptional regulator